MMHTIRSDWAEVGESNLFLARFSNGYHGGVFPLVRDDACAPCCVNVLWDPILSGRRKVPEHGDTDSVGAQGGVGFPTM